MRRPCLVVLGRMRDLQVIRTIQKILALKILDYEIRDQKPVFYVAKKVKYGTFESTSFRDCVERPARERWMFRPRL